MLARKMISSSTCRTARRASAPLLTWESGTLTVRVTKALVVEASAVRLTASVLTP